MQLTIQAELTAENFDAIDDFVKDATSSLLIIVRGIASGYSYCLKQGHGAQA